MKEFCVAGIDIGTYNCKSHSEFICRSLSTDKTSFNIRSKGILELGNVKYQIGVGSIDTEIIKSKRNNLPLFLYTLANSIKEENVKVVVGLPKYQLDEDDYVNDIKKQFIGTFNFKIDDCNRKINVLDVAIFPEGMGAYYTITNDLSDKEVIIIDIGGSTFNILWFSNGEFVKAKTLPFGSMNMLEAVRERVMQIHGGRHDMERVANYIQRGRVGKTDDTMKYTVELGQPYIDELKKVLKLEFPVIDPDYYLTGGGVEVFADCIINNFGDVNLIKDYVFANAKGNKIIGEVIFNG